MSCAFSSFSSCSACSMILRCLSSFARCKSIFPRAAAIDVFIVLMFCSFFLKLFSKSCVSCPCFLACVCNSNSNVLTSFSRRSTAVVSVEMFINANEVVGTSADDDEDDTNTDTGNNDDDDESNAWLGGVGRNCSSVSTTAGDMLDELHF